MIKIRHLRQLKTGDQIIISAPLIGSDKKGTITYAGKEPRYPITDINGNKKRSLGTINGKLKFATPGEEGYDRNSKVYSIHFACGPMSGNFDETNYKYGKKCCKIRKLEPGDKEFENREKITGIFLRVIMELF